MSEMLKIRRTEAGDIPSVLGIYAAARRYMRESGNANQWINGYPSEANLRADIKAGGSYVCLNEAGSVVGTFFFCIGEEPTYRVIHEGNWLNDCPYGVIHRIGSDGRVKGLLHRVLDFCFEQVDTVRIDTHRDNRTMIRGLERYGFRYCGIIYLEDGAERLAFQMCKKSRVS